MGVGVANLGKVFVHVFGDIEKEIAQKTYSIITLQHLLARANHFFAKTPQIGLSKAEHQAKIAESKGRMEQTAKEGLEALANLERIEKRGTKGERVKILDDLIVRIEKLNKASSESVGGILTENEGNDVKTTTTTPKKTVVTEKIDKEAEKQAKANEERLKREESARRRMATAELNDAIALTEQKNAILQAETESTLSEMDKREAFEEESRNRAKDAVMNASREVANLASAFSAEKVAGINEEIDAVRRSNMSDKEKAKAIQELENKRRVELQKSAKAQAVLNMAMFAATSAMAIVDANAFALRAMKDGYGGVGARIAQGATALAVGLGVVAQIKSAQASIAGAREHGGGVQAGSLYQVAEKGKPEMFQDASGKYLLQPSTSGRVTPIADAGMGNKVVNATFNIYGASDANVTGQTIVRLLKEVDRDGSMDWNGMANLKRTVGA
jgi:hypothetical protein